MKAIALWVAMSLVCPWCLADGLPYEMFERDSPEAEYKVDSGQHLRTRTTLWPAVEGGALIGTGGLVSNHEVRRIAMGQVRGTTLVYDGPKELPTLVYKGFGGVIDRMNFNGDIRYIRCPADERSSYGLVIDKAKQSHFGNGKVKLEDVSFSNYKVAVKVGWVEPGQNPSTEHNSDNVIVGRLFTDDCDVAYEVSHGQGLDHYFDYVRPYQTGTVFRFLGGGNLNCDMLMVLTRTHTVLDLADGNQVGSDNAIYQINAMKVDNNNKMPIFVNMRGNSASASVYFRNTHCGKRTLAITSPRFILRGALAIHLEQWTNLPPRVFVFTNDRPAGGVRNYDNVITLQAVRTGVTNVLDLFAEESRGTCWVDVYSVYNSAGEPSLTPGRYEVRAEPDLRVASYVTWTVPEPTPADPSASLLRGGSLHFNGANRFGSRLFPHK